MISSCQVRDDPLRRSHLADVNNNTTADYCETRETGHDTNKQGSGPPRGRSGLYRYDWTWIIGGNVYAFAFFGG